jgi:hypothetical protein
MGRKEECGDSLFPSERIFFASLKIHRYNRRKLDRGCLKTGGKGADHGWNHAK